MTNHDAFNQSLYDTARQYSGQSSVLSELDAMAERARRYEESKRSAVTTYQPGTVIEYAPPDPKPYANDDEAIEDLKKVFGEVVVYYGPRVVGLSVVGGVGYIVISFIQGLAAAATVTGATLAAPAAGVSLAPVGFGALALAFLWAVLSGLKGDGASKAPPAQRNGGTAQNIHVTVNVAGGNVTTNTNGK